MEESIVTAFTHALITEDEAMLAEIGTYAMETGQFAYEQLYGFWLDAIDREEILMEERIYYGENI